MLKDYSDTQLLAELISRNQFQPAPTKTQRHGEWFSSLVGIGDDETAEICLTAEAMQELGL